MVMTFTRTGGLVAAPGLNVRASVALDDSGGNVTTEDGYWRDVDAAESARLIVDAEAVAAVVAARGESRAGHPDDLKTIPSREERSREESVPDRQAAVPRRNESA